MNLALINDARSRPRPRLKGVCPGCKEPVFARCGTKRIWHWAHNPGSSCSHSKGETEWHRKWKNEFPVECQEIYHLDEKLQKHFADVKTRHGLVIEFQHSHLSIEEQTSRNEFYKHIAWVVHIWKEREKEDLRRAVNFGRPIPQFTEIKVVNKNTNDKLIEWSRGVKPVMFDIEEDDECWMLLPIQRGEELFISKIKRQDFIRLNLAEGYQCGFTRFIWDRILCIQQLLQPTEVKQKPLYRANASVLNDPFLRKIFGYQRIARPTRSLKRRRRF